MPEVEPLFDHPAKFSPEVMAALEGELRRELIAGSGAIVLDPFAGVGLVHRLALLGLETWGVEIEAPWAACHERTVHGDAAVVLAPPGRRGEQHGGDDAGQDQRREDMAHGLHIGLARSTRPIRDVLWYRTAGVAG